MGSQASRQTTNSSPAGSEFADYIFGPTSTSSAGARIAEVTASSSTGATLVSSHQSMQASLDVKNRNAKKTLTTSDLFPSEASTSSGLQSRYEGSPTVSDIRSAKASAVSALQNANPGSSSNHQQRAFHAEASRISNQTRNGVAGTSSSSDLHSRRERITPRASDIAPAAPSMFSNVGQGSGLDARTNSSIFPIAPTEIHGWWDSK